MHYFKNIFYFAILFLCFEKQILAVESEELVYGPEWTFTSERHLILEDPTTDQTEKADNRVKVYLQFKEVITQYCLQTGKCQFKEISLERTPYDYVVLSAEIKFSDSMIMNVSFDPGVFEVKAKPLSLTNWKKHQNLVQEAIFDNFAKIGFFPHEREGAGHINIGLGYFKNKAQLLRNFMVDFYNSPGVGVVLNSITANQTDAPYIDQWRDSKAKYLRLKRKLNSLDLKPNYSLNDFIYAVGALLGEKYVALGLRSVSTIIETKIGDLVAAARMEMRTLRPQKNMKDFILTLELIETRIKYLSIVKNNIKLRTPAPLLDGWAALGQFADYLEESGLNWKKYKSLMPEMWRNLDEKNFIRKKKVLILKVGCESVHK